MSKIFKVEGYVVDISDESLITPACTMREIFKECCRNFSFVLTNEPEVREFEWDDNVPVNYFDCTPEEAEEFYNQCSKGDK